MSFSYDHPNNTATAIPISILKPSEKLLSHFCFNFFSIRSNRAIEAKVTTITIAGMYVSTGLLDLFKTFEKSTARKDEIIAMKTALNKTGLNDFFFGLASSIVCSPASNSVLVFARTFLSYDLKIYSSNVRAVCAF